MTKRQDRTVVPLADRKRELTRRALEEAALHLFAERGYDATTVADIARRAGTSEATFFRYFGSKDEVLFWERDGRLPLLHDAILERPDDEPDLVAVRKALRVIGNDVDIDRDRLLLQHRALQTTPLLRGRTSDALADWERTIREALAQRRGTDPGQPTARLTAAIAMAVVGAAFEQWYEDGGRDEIADVIDDLFEHVDETLTGPRRR